MGQETLITGTGATSSVNIDVDNDGLIDTRLNLLNFYEDGRMGSSGKLFNSNRPGFSISITQINPRSKGEISISSNNKVQVNPNYLEERDDIRHLEKALEKTIDILSTNPLASIVKKINQKEMIIKHPTEYIKNNFYSGYHLIGGCADLINNRFIIKGNKSAYICDASIFDQYVSSNIHASVVLLADMFADKFLKENILNNRKEI